MPPVHARSHKPTHHLAASGVSHSYLAGAAHGPPSLLSLTKASFQQRVISEQQLSSEQGLSSEQRVSSNGPVTGRSSEQRMGLSAPPP